MEISIPDKLYKFLLLISIILIGYSSYQLIENYKGFIIESNELIKVVDTFKVNDSYLKYSEEIIIKTANNFSKEFGIQNPIKVTYNKEKKESVVNFTEIPDNKILNDSLRSLIKKFERKILSDRINRVKLKIAQRKLNDLGSTNEVIIKNYSDIKTLGYILFAIGIGLWVIDILINFDQKNSNVTKQNEKLYTFCQSCGKEFDSIINYSKNKDGTSNFAFCKNCYKKGKFKNPNITKEDIIESSIEDLKAKKKCNIFTKTLIKNRIESLDRWK